MTTRCGPVVTIAHERHDNDVNNPRGDRLIFCDLSSFYGPTAGGIRTYHEAKLRWFGAQQRHRYVLIHPGRRFAIDRVSPTVTVVTIYGAPAGAGYRLPVDFRQIRAIVSELRPDILETGDPWFTGPYGLLFRRAGLVRGLVTSFFHGNPMRTYVDPWMARGTVGRRLRRRLGARADRWFYQVQRQYDLTLASSETMERSLRAHGVTRILRAPFGADPLFFRAADRRAPRAPGTPVRLLYAGRLQPDKGVDLLIDILPRLLRRDDVSVTVAGNGTGPLAARLASLRHPRFRMLGFVSTRQAMADLYATHDVLLAPGPHETFGLSVLEGLAAGLIVIGPDAGGTGEMMAQLTMPCVFRAGDREDFRRVLDAAIDGYETAAGWRSVDGIALARRYGTWDDAIGRQVERYGEHLPKASWRSPAGVNGNGAAAGMTGLDVDLGAGVEPGAIVRAGAGAGASAAVAGASSAATGAGGEILPSGLGG